MAVIIDTNMGKEMVEGIKEIDKDIIKSYDCKKIYSPLNTHPDLQIHKVNENIVYVEPSCEDYYKKIFPEHIEIRCGASGNGGTYTSHVAYNIARVGKNVICNTKYADRNIMDYYKSNGYSITHINQGYSKCNICVVSENAVITEDKGVAKTLKRVGFNVCEISVGGVGLKGFSYGFIGGASGIVSGKLLFCGDIRQHPEYDKIYRFVRENSDLTIISLSSSRLWDFGSIIEVYSQST